MHISTEELESIIAREDDNKIDFCVYLGHSSRWEPSTMNNNNEDSTVLKGEVKYAIRELKNNIITMPLIYIHISSSLNVIQ